LPAIIEGTPRFNSCYAVGGEIEYIVRNNAINPFLIRYHNWPTSHILGTILVLFLGIDVFDLLIITPFASQIIYLISIYCIFNLLLDSKNKWLACFLFFIMNWVNQDYFSPQNYAYYLYLIYMYLIIKYVSNLNSTRDAKNSIQYKVMMIILFLSLAMAHVLTTFLVITSLILLLMMSIFFKEEKTTSFFRTLPLLALIIFTSWLLYGADLMFTRIVNLLIDSYGLENTRQATLNLATKGSISHNLIVNIRIITTLLFILSGAYNFTYLHIIKKDFSAKNYVTFVMTLTGFAALFAGRYGGEIVIRILFFMLVPMIYYALQNIKRTKISKILLFLLLILSPLLHMTCHFGNETIDYISPNELSGMEFFFKHALKNSTIISPQNNLCDVKYYEYFKHYYIPEMKYANPPCYVWITRRGEQKYVYMEEPEDLSAYNSFKKFAADLNEIYCNENIKIIVK
jgi:hypothetical protein